MITNTTTNIHTTSSKSSEMKLMVERVLNSESSSSANPSATIPDHWEVPNQQQQQTTIVPEKFKDPWIGVNHDKSILDGMSLMKDFLFNSSPIPSDEELPQLKPNWDKLMNPSTSSDEYQVTWIGHSTFLIQHRGVNIITDPVFSERCSPSQYFGPKRIKPIPFTDISKLPKIHFVIISHNHYDHLDEYAFKEIQKHHDPKFMLPFKMKYKWMMKHYTNSEVEKEKLVDLDWWKETTFKVTTENQTVSNLTFTCLPAQHWSSRTGFDRNQVLWGSWGFKFDYVEGTDSVTRSFWHAGDTGYNGQTFNQIGEKFGPIDFAMIPIGAYEPRWFMSDQHIDPIEAIKIAKEVKAKKSVGMHWGTFMLTLEPVMEPKQLLEKTLKQEGLDDNLFITMKHGETSDFKFESNTM